MDARNWSIRSKIIALVATPLSALLALWIFATVLTAGPAFGLMQMQTLLDTIGKPGELLVAELQHERRATATFLAGAGESATLTAQRLRTDRAAATFRAAAASDAARDAAGDDLDRKIDAMFITLDGLAAARGNVDRREVELARSGDVYSAIIESSFRMYYAAAGFNDPGIDSGVRALTTLGRGREWLSQVDAQLAAAFASNRIGDGEHARLVATVGTARFIYGEALADLPAADRTAYQVMVGQETFVRLNRPRCRSPPPTGAARTTAPPGSCASSSCGPPTRSPNAPPRSPSAP
jgi:hypothetical protein